MYPSLVREIVTCRAQPTHLHVYDDPVMLSCGHVFCRSCSLHLAMGSDEQSGAFSTFDSAVICPTCQCRISFQTLKQFSASLITHDTLATMVKNYIGDQKLSPSQSQSQSQSNELNEEENEKMKMKIIQTMDSCEELLSHEKIETMKNLRNQMKEWNRLLQQRLNYLEEKLNRYERQLKNSLLEQGETNETNFSKHQTIDIQPISTSITPQVKALRKRVDFREYMRVEQEVRRFTDEADRQLRLLKHRADAVPTFSFPPLDSLEGKLLGELRFRFAPIIERKKPIRKDPKLDQLKVNISGDTSLQSIPSKSPMWSVLLPARPSHLCIYPFGKSTLLFSCSSDGILSVLNYQSPVTYDSPRLLRTFHLFPNDKHVFVQSFTVFHRFLLIHVFFNQRSSRDRTDFGVLFFFTHDGLLEYKPIPLSQLIDQYVADENRLWAIDSNLKMIFFHHQPTLASDIGSFLAKREHFLSFKSTDAFLPHRLAINQQYLAVLGQDLEQIYIYDKTNRELIFTSRFAVGHQMNVTQIELFPRGNSLLLHFDVSSDETPKRSLYIHFNDENQSVGRIEGKNCLASIVGPQKEILLGFNLRTGIIRCYS